MRFVVVFGLLTLLSATPLFAFLFLSPPKVKGQWLPRFSTSYGEDVNESGQDLRHLQKEFALLSRGGNVIDMDTLMQWEEIQALLADSLVTLEEIQEIGKKATASLDSEINFDAFLKINTDLDDLFEDGTEEIDSLEIVNDLTTDLTTDGVRDMNDGETDVWDPVLQSSYLFEKDFIDYLKTFFNTNIDKKTGLLSYSRFSTWTDIREVLNDGSVDMSCLEDLWIEAVLYQNRNDLLFKNGLPTYMTIKVHSI